MRINNREKILLYSLVTIVALYIAFIYIIEPQLTEIADLDTSIHQKEREIHELNMLLATEDSLDESIKTHYAKIQTSAEGYFNTTLQEEIILLFNDFLLMPFVDESDISFNMDSIETIGGLDFKRDTVSINVSGEYDALINMLKTVWSFPKEIQVGNLSVSSTGIDSVSSSITFNLYTFMVESDVVDNLYKWYINDLFFKENPFIPYKENDIIVRYLYIGEKDEIFNYSKYFKFQDVEGHWIEDEINEFLDLGYVYLNPYLVFEPEKPISRGEFIVMLDNVYNWTISDENIDLSTFRDYDELGSLESSFAKAIYRGFLSGIIEGYEDSTLRPRDPISYEEVGIIMNKINETEDFEWITVSEKITNQKGIESENWADDKNYMTKAEAVFLLYYAK